MSGDQPFKCIFILKHYSYSICHLFPLEFQVLLQITLEGQIWNISLINPPFWCIKCHLNAFDILQIIHGPNLFSFTPFTHEPIGIKMPYAHFTKFIQ